MSLKMQASVPVAPYKSKSSYFPKLNHLIGRSIWVKFNLLNQKFSEAILRRFGREHSYGSSVYNLPSDWQINQSSWIPPPPPHSNAQFQPDLSSHQVESQQIFSTFLIQKYGKI